MFIRLRMNITARDLQLKTKTYYVYIMASRSLNLYTGITNSIYRRALQHKHGEIDGFTKRYNIDRLVYYEVFHQVGNAIAREKQIKAWTRAKRIALIQTKNPTWQDLAEGWGEKFEVQIPFDSVPAVGPSGKAPRQTRGD
jgi:putative endonuclease